MEQQYTFFWNADEENGFLSNWYPCRFTIDGIVYRNTEQYFMAQKAITFGDTETLTRIMQAQTAKECKELGRGVTPFDGKVWASKSYAVMKTGCRAKFEQNPALRDLLLATGHTILAEASPYDGIWGILLDRETAGKTPPENWPGANKMGRILTELRDEFQP